ncbi:MAG: ABC transporter permease [Bacteroidetes bacterium]|nr:ABC transporter permease [Bacteroidota bacterium]
MTDTTKIDKENGQGLTNEFQQEIKGNSLTKDAWKRLKKNRMAVISIVVIAIYATLSLFAPLLPIHSHTKIILEHQNLRPSFTKTAGELLLEKKEKELFAFATGQAVTITPEQKAALKKMQPNQQFDFYYDLGKSLGTVSLSASDQRILDNLKEKVETELLFDIKTLYYIDAAGDSKSLNKLDVQESAEALSLLTGTPAEDILERTYKEANEQIRKELQIENENINAEELDLLLTTHLNTIKNSAYNRYLKENLDGKIVNYAIDFAQQELDEVVKAGDAEFPLKTTLSMADYFTFKVEASKKHERIYIFGTDYVGRDMFARIIYGGQISIAIGFIGTITSVLIGTILGALAGYIGGKTDYLIMRVVDVLYGLPYMLLVIILMAIFGRNIMNLFFALAIISWLTVARVVRGQIISLKNSEFVEAAMSMGASTWRIVFKHLVPNSLGVIIVFSTLRVPAFIMLESFLSFLGLGISAPFASWGSLIGDAVEGMNLFPWRLLFPALAMSVFLFAMNFLGDGLRDAFDPQSKNQL